MISKPSAKDSGVRDMPWFEKISGKQAEKMLGRNLDKRKQYYRHTKEGATVDNPYAFNGSGTPCGTVFVLDKWRQECSGCCGQGCHECGYHGHRIETMHFPVDLTFKENQNDTE